MSWYYDASFLSIFVVAILLFDISANSTRSYVLTNSIFRVIGWLSLLLVLSDLFVSLAGHFVGLLPGWMTTIFCLSYFLCFPLLALSWFYYCFSIAMPDIKISRGVLIPSITVYGIYAVLVLGSMWTDLIFTVDASSVYHRGTGYPLFILIVGLYILAAIIVIACRFRSMDRRKALILSSYPIISILTMLLQFFVPYHAWGSCGYCLLLLFIYLNIQNRRLLYDSVTDVANRNAFIARIDHLLKKGMEGEVCLFALDNFKFFNQKFGQANGDLILKEIAAFLTSASPSNRVYRYGGDQFVCIIDDGYYENSCDEFVRAVFRRFNSPWDICAGVTDGGAASSSGESVSSMLSLCAVTVTFPHQASSISEITSALDFALLEAKSRGKGQLVAYDYSTVSRRRRTHEILAALNKAIKDDSFELYYQPVIETATGHMLSAEALLRLQDPVLGWISPLELIPIAEENGLIVDLTYKIIKRVCQTWNALGNRTGHLDRITINLSSSHFLQENMGAMILETIARYNGNPNHIKFEVSEGMAVESFSTIREVMELLGNEGINFALDNFGKGYSSLNYLLELPFSVVKVDRSIIWQSDRHAELLDSVVHLLRRLNKKVVAEGVENAKQLAMVKALGIEHVQGFYYCSPIPEREFIELVHEDTGEDYRFSPRHNLGDGVTAASR